MIEYFDKFFWKVFFFDFFFYEFFFVIIVYFYEFGVQSVYINEGKGCFVVFVWWVFNVFGIDDFIVVGYSVDWIFG